MGEPTEGSEQLPRRSHRAGDDDRPVSVVGHSPGDRRRSLGQLEHSALRPVQRQPISIAAERVGEDDVGPGVDEALVEHGDVLGAIDVPQLRRLARSKPIWK